MIYLPQLRDQLVATGATSARRARRPFVLLAAALAMSGLAAGALAATGVIPIGKPVKPISGFIGNDPERGAGAIVPGSARLLALRVPDPAGGPPWGLRVVGTTRGVGCVQVGRVVDDNLGVLGQDGIAGNDGRFHELPLNAVDVTNCQALDAAGHLFVSVMGKGFLASGPSDAQRSCLGPGSHAGPNDPIQIHCPAADQRALAFGLLGPQATSITSHDAGTSRTVPVSSPDGAYLIVTRSDADIAGVSPGVTPIVGVTAVGRRDYPLERVTYRDGSQCPGSLPARRPAIVSCPLVGYARPAGAAPTDAQVARTLDVRLGHVRMYGARRLRIRVGFRAPVAISGAGSVYALEIDLPRSGRCARLRAMPLTTDRDITAKEPVHFTTTIPAQCRGRVHGTVRLVTPTTESRRAADPRTVTRLGPGRRRVHGPQPLTRRSRHSAIAIDHSTDPPAVRP